VEADNFAATQKSLQLIMESPNGSSKRLEGCIKHFFEPFIFEYGNNLADYFGHLVSLGGSHRVIGLKMISILSELAKEQKITKRLSSLTALIIRLPFLGSAAKETALLIGSIIEDDETQHYDVDLSSQGKLQTTSHRPTQVGSVKYTTLISGLRLIGFQRTLALRLPTECMD
jgi:hypothetical protein